MKIAMFALLGLMFQVTPSVAKVAKFKCEIAKEFVGGGGRYSIPDLFFEVNSSNSGREHVSVNKYFGLPAPSNDGMHIILNVNVDVVEDTIDGIDERPKLHDILYVYTSAFKVNQTPPKGEIPREVGSELIKNGVPAAYANLLLNLRHGQLFKLDDSVILAPGHTGRIVLSCYYP